MRVFCFSVVAKEFFDFDVFEVGSKDGRNTFLMADRWLMFDFICESKEVKNNVTHHRLNERVGQTYAKRIFLCDYRQMLWYKRILSLNRLNAFPTVTTIHNSSNCHRITK